MLFVVVVFVVVRIFQPLLLSITVVICCCGLFLPFVVVVHCSRSFLSFVVVFLYCSSMLSFFVVVRCCYSFLLFVVDRNRQLNQHTELKVVITSDIYFVRYALVGKYPHTHKV